MSNLRVITLIIQVTEGTYLNPMLQTEELPTSISKLDACLTNVDRKTFSHNERTKLINLFNCLSPLR